VTTEIQHTNLFWERGNRGPHPFTDLSQLKELPILQAYSAMPKFVGFAFEHDADNEVWWTMALFDRGFEWYVIGHTDQKVDGLPEWDKGRYQVKTPGGGVLLVNGADVASSVGNIVVLKDGRQCVKVPRKKEEL